jgi:protein gp37
MAENSKISWTDHTFNPWWGCVKVSPACDHCYAESFSKRVGENVWGKDAPRRTFGDKHWNEPLKWNREALELFGRPARVFCASMADVFEVNPTAEELRPRLLTLIQATPNLQWNLLTKRALEIKRHEDFLQQPNVSIGVTVENESYTNRVVSGVTWVSAEPLLGPFRLWRVQHTDPRPYRPMSWLIIGGESGAGAREMKLEWALSLIEECKEAGVAVHFKQLGDILADKLGVSQRKYQDGTNKDGSPKMRRDVSGKRSEFWPKELQIQEFPKPTHA